MYKFEVFLHIFGMGDAAVFKLTKQVDRLYYDKNALKESHGP